LSYTRICTRYQLLRICSEGSSHKLLGFLYKFRFVPLCALGVYSQFHVSRNGIRPLEDDDIRRRPQAWRHDGANGARWPHGRAGVPGVGRADAGADARARPSPTPCPSSPPSTAPATLSPLDTLLWSNRRAASSSSADRSNRCTE